MELEDRLIVPSAEGIDLELVLAGVGSRAAALLADMVIEVLALALLALALGAFGDVGAAGLAIGTFLVLFGYPTLMEAFNGGQTVGKMLLGIAAVGIEGQPLTFLQAVIRNVVRPIDLLPGTYLVAFVAILASPKNQRVGDMAANTLVIRRRRAGVTEPLPTAYSAVDGLGVAVDTAGWDVSAVSAEQVAAAREFLGRRQELTPAMREQIASALASQVVPRVAGVPLDGGPEAVLERVVLAKYGR